MKRHAVNVCMECVLWASGVMFDEEGQAAAERHTDKVDAMWGVYDYQLFLYSRDPDPFSTSPCECCGDRMHGPRYSGEMISTPRVGRATEFHLEV